MNVSINVSINVSMNVSMSACMYVFHIITLSLSFICRIAWKRAQQVMEPPRTPIQERNSKVGSLGRVVV